LVYIKANALFVLNNKYMLKVLFSAIAMLTVQAIFAQNIDVDKNSGLVKIDGKDSFYLIKKNKILFNFDVSLQNLNKQELAYFAQKNVNELPDYLRVTHTAGTFYFVTFSETANTAYLFPISFSALKGLARQIVTGNLIKDQQIDQKAERAFVVSHDGNVMQEPQAIQVNVNTDNNPPAASTSAPVDITITVKENSIYDNDQLIGSFKESVKDSLSTISVYNTSDVKIAIATHNDADANADWNVTVPSDNSTYQFLYNQSSPWEKLFKALVSKGLL
jgi:hypothetical protein